MDPHTAARRVVARLQEAGHEAYFVGGCVRDHLCGQPLEAMTELDVATSARPEEIEALFPRTFGVGRNFGVLLVRLGGCVIEVATFRTEADYRDGRRPSQVRFATAREDVARRDFTVNGVLLDPSTGRVLDYVGGVADIESRRIRTIGDPAERFAEDGLRLLRAVRFGSLRDFQLDPATRRALSEHRGRLAAVAAERIQDELGKLARHPEVRRGDAWLLLHGTGLAGEIDPAWGALEPEPVGASLDRLRRRDLESFLAVLLLASLRPGATPREARERVAELSRRLRLSRESAARLLGLVQGQLRVKGWSRLSLARRRLLARGASGEELEDLVRATSGAGLAEALREEREREPMPLEPPLLDGRELLALGARPGPALGRLLRRLCVLQLEGRLRDAAAAREAAVRGASRRALAKPSGEDPTSGIDPSR
jgi:tRNA nucleotidyltransferase/poly(A) polymerase